MHEQPAVALFCCFLFVFSLRVRWEVAKIGDGDDVSHCLSWGEWGLCGGSMYHCRYALEWEGNNEK